MKVLLINPPYPFEENPSPPFGLMSLAAFLEEQGMEVKIEDCNISPYSESRIKKLIHSFHPDIVGVTSVTMTVNKALLILKVCKSIRPNVITVMGGPHVSFDADDILYQNIFIDYVVRGEGEITFTELLKALEEGKNMDRITGLSYKKKGKVVHMPDRPFISDINILPYPARHLVKLSKYRALGMAVNMTTSRGCPNRCIFCVGSKMVGQRVRYFAIDRVVDEFELLSGMGFRQINIVDDLFTANKKRCLAICDEIARRGISHRWTAFARVDTVNRELLEGLKTAGCAMLCFGVESGDQEILDRIKKNITLDKCRNAIDLCKDVGIEPMASYILGLPGETEETFRKTIDFAKELGTLYGFHILAPFPGTEVRDRAEEYGLKIFSNDWDLYDANRSVAESIFISREEIDCFVNEFNSGIKRYVESLGKREREGESLSEEDRRLVGSIESFEFSRDLIHRELVEMYPGSTNGCSHKQVKQGFMDYLAEKTGKPLSIIMEETERLFKMGSLFISDDGNCGKVLWSQN